MGQRAALIRHWLHMEPPEDTEAFLDALSQADWLERRYWETMAKMMGAHN